MRYHRQDVVAQALALLDAYGLGDLTMRRLAQELGLRPSALYHHFETKQALLAAVADEILARDDAAPVGAAGAAGGEEPTASGGDRAAPPSTGGSRWDVRVEQICLRLRESLLTYRDGAEVVATVYALGLGAQQPYVDLTAALGDAGLDARTAQVAARTLLHFVLGHVSDEQLHAHAGSAGAIAAGPREESDFATGLGLVLEGVRSRVLQRASRRP